MTSVPTAPGKRKKGCHEKEMKEKSGMKHPRNKFFVMTLEQYNLTVK